MNPQFVPLPLELLLLIHLQTLQHPNINDDLFDMHIFDAQKRSLRPRIKMMEDISYWLVEKLEGKNAKKILATYPCIKPSETIAFRTSFAKYLENTRQSSIRENSASSSWWKDVQVRKSLLEECAGVKFLRLILALSTQVIYSRTNRGFQNPGAISYTSFLIDAQASQQEWVQVARMLLEHEKKVLDMKAQLVATKSLPSQSKYASLSTARLIALRDSKMDDFLRQHCGSSELARKALTFFVGPTGLRFNAAGKQHILLSGKPPLIHRHIQPQVLAVAAAHHPSCLRRLRKSVFQLADSKLSELAPPVLPSVTNVHQHALQSLQISLDATKHRRFTLEEALAKVTREKSLITERLIKPKSEKRLTSARSEIGVGHAANATRAGKKSHPSKPKTSLRPGVWVHVGKRAVAGRVQTVSRDVVSFWEDRENVGNLLGLNFNCVSLFLCVLLLSFLLSTLIR
ncbi:hypothetical protein BDP27DRAFT_428596 [Rhodocollybia butyracea]|uniref:HAUS augmin-like complex subunit 6 N-terminal domain-containing protein n=1 Tax=Rhodocollybia butyracea TaxID=206335 RepID=A0A9P5UAT3_9AGAR|nr:hypothetical protein BDP27DRAFT_428596 [Rhodocollybia butyracea]